MPQLQHTIPLLHHLQKIYGFADRQAFEREIELFLEEYRDSPEEVRESAPLYYKLWDQKDEFPELVREAIYYSALHDIMYRESDDRKRSPPPELYEDGKINYRLLADTLIKRYCIISYSPDGKKSDFYIFDGKKYVEGEKIIEKRAMELLWASGYPENKKIKHHINEVKEIIASRCAIREFPFNKLTNFIPVNNGVLWVRDDGSVLLLPHSPVFGFQYCLPVDYDPDADCPKIKSFLRSLVNDEGSLEILYEIPASCLTRTTKFQYAYFLYGSGSNGKSTYLNLVEKLLGEENVSHISLQDLCNSRFRAAGLIGKLANIYSDLSSKMLGETGTFKALTGEDSITIERKFREPIYNYRNTTRLIFSANEFPRTVDETDAFWRRWIVVKFPNKFSPNPHLFDQITTPEELSGFLNEVLKRLPKILNCEPTIVTDAKVEWIRNSNSLRAFEIDCIIKDPNSYVEKKELYEYYKQYCEIRGMKVASYNRFCRFMQKITTDKQIRIAGKATRVWVGIKVRLPDEEVQEENESEGGYDSITPLNDHSRLLNLLEYNDDEDNSSEDENQDDRVEYTKIKLIKLPVGTDHIEFLGVDGKEYRLYLDQEAEVPSINAKPLLEWGYAIKVG